MVHLQIIIVDYTIHKTVNVLPDIFIVYKRDADYHRVSSFSL